MIAPYYGCDNCLREDAYISISYTKEQQVNKAFSTECKNCKTTKAYNIKKDKTYSLYIVMYNLTINDIKYSITTHISDITEICYYINSGWSKVFFKLNYFKDFTIYELIRIIGSYKNV